MIHFLRDKNNNSIVDTTAMANDLRAGVIIHTFAAMLLSLPDDKQLEFIDDMDAMAELRGEYHEDPRRCGIREAVGMPRDQPGDPPLETPDELCERRFREMAEKWGLRYVTD